MLFRIIVGFLLVFLFSYITPATLSAAVPELSLVPAGCAQEKTLLRERESLEGQMKDLMDTVKANKARCGSVDPGSALEADCLEEGKRIKQRYAELVEAYTQFNTAVKVVVEFTNKLNSTDDKDVPIHAPYPNAKDKRNAYEYSKVVGQFRVNESLRYKEETIIDKKTGERKKETFCNVFARDVAWAMGAELPSYENTYGMIKWLNNYGKARGWHKATNGAEEAQDHASQGHLTIAIIPGHIAVVRPGSSVGEPFNSKGPAIAQAGRKVVNVDHLNDTFGSGINSVTYWYHD